MRIERVLIDPLQQLCEWALIHQMGLGAARAGRSDELRAQHRGHRALEVGLTADFVVSDRTWLEDNLRDFSHGLHHKQAMCRWPATEATSTLAANTRGILLTTAGFLAIARCA